MADLDGDGDADVAVVNGGSNNVSILLNNGSASFTNATGSPVAAGLNSRSVAAGDLDGDGDIDLVTANASVNTLSVLLNNGDATFTNATGSPIGSGGSVPFEVVLADLDGDTNLDIAVTNAGSNSLSIFLNNGDATFTTATGSPIGVGSIPRGLTAADLDGDNDLDFVVVNSS